MFWFYKRFPYGAAWASDQDRFASLQMVVAGQGGDEFRSLIMAVASNDETDVVYLGFPKAELASAFPEYTRIEPPLPKMTSLLVGDAEVSGKHITVVGVI